MNAPLPLHKQAQSNERAPYANRVEPGYLAADPERMDAFIASEAKRLAGKMHARLERNAPDEYEVAQAFASSSNAAFYRLMQLAEVGNADAVLVAVKKMANEAIDERADLLATQEWQKLTGETA
jgi:hypothetical protein